MGRYDWTLQRKGARKGPIQPYADRVLFLVLFFRILVVGPGTFPPSALGPLLGVLVPDQNKWTRRCQAMIRPLAPAFQNFYSKPRGPAAVFFLCLEKSCWLTNVFFNKKINGA